MRIKQILWQNRRDFKAIFVCPHCGYEWERKGYDDANFHRNVIPTLECPECGKTETDDTGYRALATKYPEGYQV